MHPRLSELTQYVDAQRAALLSAAEQLPDAQWTLRPAPDRWSVSDVFEHLHRVERGSARLIAMRAAEARLAGHPPEVVEDSVMDSLAFARLTDRTAPIEAPARVAPEGGWTRTAADGLALASVRHEHPRLGDIDLYQWILFIGQHEARHVPQVSEIVAALLTPARA